MEFGVIITWFKLSRTDAELVYHEGNCIKKIIVCKDIQPWLELHFS